MTVSPVLPLDDPVADLDRVGGKGASLARLARAGLPVPGGFHVTTDAYRRFIAQDGLREGVLAAAEAVRAEDPGTFEAAAERIATLFAARDMPREIGEAIVKEYGALGGPGGGAVPVAVRSSATAEDLPELSFAGQQDSYLNIRGEAALLDAVRRCWASLWTARAIGYRARHGIAARDVALAVVVQRMVEADAAGVVFTADPVTGARERITINAAWGLGEAVVGGHVTPDTVVADRTGVIVEQRVGDKRVMTVGTAGGTRQGPVPPELRGRPVLDATRVAELASLAVRIEEEYGTPMDVEWAAGNGELFIVQARPITVTHGEEWNDSLGGDYLWTNANLGEAIPDVMTPCTWSAVRRFMGWAMATGSVPGLRSYGNIGGRFYLNLSMSATLAGAFGVNRKRYASLTRDVFGALPPGLDIPPAPVSRLRILRLLIPVAIGVVRRVRANKRQLPAFLATVPGRCDALRERIARVGDPAELAALWHTDVEPLLRRTSRMLEAAGRQDGGALVLVRRRLERLAGEDLNALTSGLHSESGPLASLGPLLGLDRLSRGEIDAQAYARRYGHRGAHEFEVSMPRPAEDPEWISRRLAWLRTSGQDVPALLAAQEAARERAWERLRARHPRAVAAMRRRVDRWAASARARELARSEVIRVFWVVRALVLRAGELTGYGDAVFFLSIEEVLGLLGGDRAALASVPARRGAYERYRSLPPYPTLIRGRFDPVRWAADPDRRGDLYDEHGTAGPAGETITGFPGSAGVVEGTARVIASPDEGERLRPGDVLVTTVTNIGWTPLFPRAGAVVTDVGAPLSHAAIVARELGIPAVVGCGDATTRLRDGERVRVDGARGTVEVLGTASVGQTPG